MREYKIHYPFCLSLLAILIPFSTFSHCTHFFLRAIFLLAKLFISQSSFKANVMWGYHQATLKQRVFVGGGFFLPEFYFMECFCWKAISKHCQNWKQNKSPTVRKINNISNSLRLNQIKLALHLNFKGSQELIHLRSPIKTKF